MERLLKLLDYFRYDFDSCRRSWSRRFYAFQHLIYWWILRIFHNAVQCWWYDVCIYFSRLCYAICQFVIYKCFQIGIQCVPFIFVAIACRFITFLSQLSTEWMMLERGSLKKEWLRYAFPTLRSEWQMSELLFFAFILWFPRTETCTKRQTHIIGFGLSLIDLHNC